MAYKLSFFYWEVFKIKRLPPRVLVLYGIEVGVLSTTLTRVSCFSKLVFCSSKFQIIWGIFHQTAYFTFLNHTGATMEVNISHRSRQEILTTSNLADPDLFRNALNELIQLMKTVGNLLAPLETSIRFHFGMHNMW